MFIQVIQGQTADAEGILRQAQKWLDEVRPGAVGWLGTTGGVTDDGRAIVLARFESAAAAKANSDRPEQGAWWEEMRACFSGEPVFHESEDIAILLDGGSDAAGFVQVMQGRTGRRQDMEAMEKDFENLLREVHPGLIGSVRCWYGDGEFTDAAYFTDEATARQGEKAMGENEQFQEMMGDWEDINQNTTFFDLRDPILASA